MATNKSESISPDDLATIITNSYTTLGISMGYHTGLFQHMLDNPEPQTSYQLAESCGLKERYVREWLGIMTCSKIAQIDPSGIKFHIPPDLSKALVSTIGPRATNIPTLCEGYFAVRDCFNKEGPRGTPYSAYPSFNPMMATLTNTLYNWDKTEIYLKDHPDILALLESGVEVLDDGCGQGLVSTEMAIHFPRNTILGIDFEEEAVQEAKAGAKCSNVQFEVQDVYNLPSDWSNKFSFIFAQQVIHDLSFPRRALTEIFRVLKDDGVFSVIDDNLNSEIKDNVTNPKAVSSYTSSLFWCMPTSLFPEGGAGLGSCWGKELACELLTEGGFEVLDVCEHANVVHYVCKKQK